ncbi:hypothetical protein MHYP_G00119840 [Metynnis hypsauchen]
MTESRSARLYSIDYSVSLSLSVARCLPRCHNRAVCRQPNICQCRPGFHGYRCELSSVTPAPSVWSWTTSSRTSALVTTITAPAAPGTASPVTTATYITPVVTTTGLWSRSKDSESDPKRKYSLRWQPRSMKEAQAALLKKALARGVGGSKITNILLKHIETERNRLQSIPNTAETQQSSSKTFHTQHGQYTLVYAPAVGQTATGQTAGGQRTFGVLGGSERIKVLFTPTICRLRCSQNRCTNYCERGNVTTVYNSEQQGAPGSAPPGFRVCSPMVKVRVQHPPEASVKIHQVLKVGPGPHGRSFCREKGQEAPPPRVQARLASVQAQTIRGDSTYTESSGFKYCFREVRNGQCSSPMPGLRSQETCCRGDGLAWGISECTLCPPELGSRGRGEGSCPKGFERVNGTQCVDINECEQTGFCQNGNCVNTRGSYSCACRQGFLLDASHGICISQKVISEEKDQCFRIVSQGSCSLPILRTITKQICCCSRVGKAWGRKCEACPYFGSDEFKEICPAGPGYHYSPNTLKFIQRVAETHGTPLVSELKPQQPESSVSQPAARNQPPTSPQTTRPQPPTVGQATRVQQPNVFIIQGGPQQTSGAGAQTQSRPAPAATATSQPTRAQPPVVRTQTGRPSASRQPLRPLPVPATSRPSAPRTDVRVCEVRPQVCGPGRCVDVAGGRHTCVCNPGFIFSTQAGRCQDINECVLTPRPCSAGQCENTVGSFRCVCPAGYQGNAQQNQCSDVDECDDPLRCPGQECVNSQGSYKCVPCRPGFGLLNGQCSDIDECRQSPSLCSNGRCENTAGSYRCACRLGYRTQGNTCTDVNECEDPLQCPGQECVNTQGSYRCVTCRPGFAVVSGRCSDVDECRQVPAPCTNGRCENTLGSYRCVCRTGYRLQGNTCTDVNECEDPRLCPGQECVNTPGSYRCASCRSGYTFRNGQCTDVDECVQSPGLCSNGRCENTPGSYRCVCRPGFRPEGNTCADVDECENELQCPGQECVNSVGSFNCVSCKPGFEIVNGQCKDMDECSHTPRCANGRCENTPGSYRCACRPGFRLQGNTCTDVDECADVLQCPGQQCVNSMGSYECVRCRDGYSLQNGQCADVDECVNSRTCGLQSVCVNTDGSYRCECTAGYRAAGPGRLCRDINECLEGEFCFPRGECLNTEGSYMCLCAQGYQTSANRTSCEDVDECAREGLCQDGRCVNTDGSFQCNCKTGFTANPETTACLDVDECVDSEGAVCGSLRCENTIGSFRCLVSCQPGYSITTTGECVDVNECANETVCGEHAFCQNLIGTYQCICDQGYESTGDGRSCADINECETMVGVCGAARCWNVDGSFTCECEDQQKEFNPLTLQCVNRAGRGETGASAPRWPSFSPSRSGSITSLPPAGPEEKREAGGQQCLYQPCPEFSTAEFQTLCPSGQGYVTSTVGAFSYKDVDECKLFDLGLCKGGVCVNNIPGYSCYCPSGYYHDNVLLECIDNDECDSEEMCPGGVCVNTLGSYYCTCEDPLVLDDTQRFCVNISDPTANRDLSVCWQHVTADLVCQRMLPRTWVTFVDCCCLHGEAWGLQCALCPRRDEEAYETLCSSLGPPANSPRYAERFALVPGRGGDYGPPYGGTVYGETVPGRADYTQTDYDDYSPMGGTDRRSGLRGQTPGSYTPYIPPGLGPARYYEEDDYDAAPVPPYGMTDPRSEPAFGTRPRPPLAEGRTLSLSALPEDAEGEGPWRAPAPFPPFTNRRAGGEGPRRVYERQYEPFGGLMEGECGILQGCENGRCVRVPEGYTCDCYDGYQLDISSMSCRDVDECEDPGTPACVNGQCVNTEGSYRCVCLRGFVTSRRPNHCIPA